MYSVFDHCCGMIAKIKNSEFLCIVLDVVNKILQKKNNINTENSKLLNIFSKSRSSGIFLSKKEYKTKEKF